MGEAERDANRAKKRLLRRILPTAFPRNRAVGTELLGDRKERWQDFGHVVKNQGDWRTWERPPAGQRYP